MAVVLAASIVVVLVVGIVAACVGWGIQLEESNNG